MDTIELIKKTKEAVKFIKAASSETKNKAIEEMAESLVNHTKEILEANKIDLENAEGKISEVMKDRLMLNEERIKAMAKGMREIIALPDPVGDVLSEDVRPNGLKITKKRVPMGLIAIIYESRPNVTSDAACLSVKSGNAVVLRGGKEAYNTSASATAKAMETRCTPFWAIPMPIFRKKDTFSIPKRVLQNIKSLKKKTNSTPLTEVSSA